MSFKTYLETEVARKINEKIAALHNYGALNEVEWYLTDDIMCLLCIKSIWHKLNNLIEEQEKTNRTVSVNNVSRYRTLITKKAVCKIIASMRRKPHDLICKFFECASESLPVPIVNNYEVGPSNIYIKRLLHIFSSQKIETFYKVDITSKIIVLDIFFSTHGIAVLFNKTHNIFAEENIAPYIAARSEVLKKFIHLKDLKVIQFTAYDSKSFTQFDELIKVLFEALIA